MSAPQLYELLKSGSVRQIAGIASKLRTRAWIVGGGPRDHLLGRAGKDIDFVLESCVEELPRRFAAGEGGSFFWLDQERGQSRVVVKADERQLLFDFAPLVGGSIESDLANRDFTINALAVELGGSGKVIDPFGGVRDISRRVIRHCGPDSFAADPLRLLRAVRFAAVLGFAIAAETIEEISIQADLLGRVARERIRDEFFQIIATARSADSMRILVDTGLLPSIIPLAPEGLPSDSFEKLTAVETLLTRLDHYFPESSSPLRALLDEETEGGITTGALLKLAALLSGSVTASPASVADSLRLGKRSARVLALLLDCGRVSIDNLTDDPGSQQLYRFFRDREPAGPATVLLAMATGEAEQTLCVRMINYRCTSYRASDQDLLLSGSEVMTLLGLQPGPEVGRAMDILREAESSGRVSTSQEARVFLLKNLLTNDDPIG